jgi:hypothetical protein
LLFLGQPLPARLKRRSSVPKGAKILVFRQEEAARLEKAGRSVIRTAFTNGKRHDFRLFKESKARLRPETELEAGAGHQGIAKIHANSVLPKKRAKKNPLTAADKRGNREVSSGRVTNEQMIGFIKRLKIVADRYSDRQKRFGPRFNLIAGICNFELPNEFRNKSNIVINRHWPPLS